MIVNKLIQLVQHYKQELNKFSAYGGRVLELPPNHHAGIIVPKGGSSCANCKWAEIRNDGPHCLNKYFVQWSGTSRLPVDDPEAYCKLRRRNKIPARSAARDKSLAAIGGKENE